MYLINLLAEKIKSFRANESKSHTNLYEFKEDKAMNIYYENIQWKERLSALGHRSPIDSTKSVNKEISDWNGLYFPKIAHGKVRPEFESPISNQIDFANSITDASGNQVIFKTAEDCIEWIKENVKEQYWPNTEKERRIARSERYLK